MRRHIRRRFSKLSTEQLRTLVRLYRRRETWVRRLRRVDGAIAEMKK